MSDLKHFVRIEQVIKGKYAVHDVSVAPKPGHYGRVDKGVHIL